MLYITTKDKLQDPRFRVMPRTHLGESFDQDVWTNKVRVDTWKAVQRRNPGEPWKHMRELYGTGKGKAALILGSGKSLEDVGEIPPGVVTFAINRAIRRVKADYWCFHDVDSLAQNMDHPNAEAAKWIGSIQLYTYLKERPFYAIEVNGEPMRWRIADERPLYWSETTTGSMIHLAIRMGFEKIVLHGHDYPGRGHFDGYVQGGHDETWQLGQHFGVMDRLQEMFSEQEKPHWFERPVDIVDTTPVGFIPVRKGAFADECHA